MAEISLVPECRWCKGKTKVIDVAGELIDDRLVMFIDLECEDCHKSHRRSATYEEMLRAMIVAGLQERGEVLYSSGAFLHNSNN